MGKIRWHSHDPSCDRRKGGDRVGVTRRRAARWKRMQGETDAGRASDEGGRVAQRREVSAPIGGLLVRYPWSL